MFITILGEEIIAQNCGKFGGLNFVLVSDSAVNDRLQPGTLSTSD